MFSAGPTIQDMENWAREFALKNGRLPTELEAVQRYKYIIACRDIWSLWMENKIDVTYTGKDFAVITKKDSNA